MVTYLNLGLAAFVDHVEGKVLHVGLDRGIVKSSADQSLGIKDGVGGVHGHLVLGGITNQSFGIGEGHKRWGGSVALVVGDDLDLAMLEHTDARIGGAQINTDSGSGSHCSEKGFEERRHKVTRLKRSVWNRARRREREKNQRENDGVLAKATDKSGFSNSAGFANLPPPLCALRTCGRGGYHCQCGRHQSTPVATAVATFQGHPYTL